MLKLNPFPSQSQLLRQIVVQVGIVDQKKQKQLKQQFDKKYSKHINLIQYHQLRQERFQQAQQKVLQKQSLSIEKTKQIIQNRQHRADSLKEQQIENKSKRIQTSLGRWEKTIEKSKQIHQKKLKQSINLIEQWNEKLTQSSSRKSLRLNNISRILRKKSSEKISKLLIHKHNEQQQQELRIRNSQAELMKKQSDSRNSSIISGRKHSRVSTESAYNRLKRSEQNLLQKSLLKNGEKIEKINEARNIKRQIQQKKTKIHQQKQEDLKRLRQHHLSQIKQSVDERNQKLDKKFKSDKVKPKNKKSLPSVLDNKSSNIIFSNGQPSRRKNQYTIPQQKSTQELLGNHQAMSERVNDWSPSYDKLIIQKLRNVAILVRKRKKI